MADNRTNEFMSMARKLPKDGGLPPQILSAPPPGSNSRNSNDRDSSKMSQLKDFHNTAGGISRDIASTSSLLADLTQLVKQKSLFQDDSQKVNELVVRIKSAIENLNGRLDDAERQSTQQKRTLGKNSQTAQAASNVVGQLQEEFGEAAKGFKSILQQRTDAMKETTDRKKGIYGNTGNDFEDVPVLNLGNRPPVYSTSENNNESMYNSNGGFGGGMGAGGFPTLDLTSGMMAAGEPTGSQLPRPHGATPINSRPGSSAPNYSGSGTSNYYGQSGGAANMLSPFDIQRMEQESGQGQTMQLIPDQNYLRERADAMEQVEQNMVELGAVYGRLATMVSEHKDMVQRVEDNVDEANNMVTLGMNQLVDTLDHLKSNKGLALKLFSIMTVFIIFFIVFFA